MNDDLKKYAAVFRDIAVIASLLTVIGVAWTWALA